MLHFGRTKRKSTIMEFHEKYQIEIYVDETYKSGSADNLNKYDFEYFSETKYQLTTQIGIKVLENAETIYSAIIGSEGGATGIFENSVIIEEDKVLICCSDSVFCLSLPELKILWKTKTDEITCFGLYKKDDFYIVHGELAISKLNNQGKILWQNGGADIFVTISGENDFEMTKKLIIAKDWNNKIYKFDFDGNEFTDMQQFKL